MFDPADPGDRERAAQAEIARLTALLGRQAASAEAERQRLTFELGHRVRNTLGVVQALASQTLRTAASPEAALDSLNHRILALARANDAILEEGWTCAAIGPVSRRVLEAEGSGFGPLDIDGPDLRIPAACALSYAMALHELAMNARRHGAWTSPGGRIALDWRIEAAPDGDRLVLAWQETGGPAATAPAKRGFGLRLIEQSLKSAFGHDVTVEFAPRGLSVHVVTPLADLQPAT